MSDYYVNMNMDRTHYTLRDLQQTLRQKYQEISEKDSMIETLISRVHEKDALISYLKNELDKYKTVIKPITQQLNMKLPNLGSNKDSGDLATLSSSQPEIPEVVRTKKLAVSAEPGGCFTDAPTKYHPKSQM